MSLLASNLMTTTWTGLGNYARALGDKQFLQSALNSAEYAVILVPAVTLLPMAAALLAYPESRRWHDWTRISFYIPGLASTVVVMGVWSWILGQNREGLANQLLGIQHRWLLDRATGVPSISLVLTVFMLGGSVLLYLAALTSIPRENVEAAQVEGASYLQTARYVLAPPLYPVARLVALMTTIGAVQHTETVLLLAPYDHTASMAFQVYRSAFIHGEHGYGAAQAVLMIAVVAALGVAQRRVAR